MEEYIKRALQDIKDYSVINDVKPISGGDINEAYYVKTEKRQYFLKCNTKVEPEFFEVEMEGLLALKNSNAVQTPHIYGVYKDNKTDFYSIILEWIEGEATCTTGAQLGIQLANLHQFIGDSFGYDHTTYIGELKQVNGWWKNWSEYFKECRLKPQMMLGVQQGKMDSKRLFKMEYLLDHIENWIPNNVSPVLLHGDLWGGNWIVGPKGVPYFIDPSVFYGHNEMEISFTELFGGFPSTFYEAYHEVLPIDEEYHNRKEIYQLYYLLLHLNLFGEMYGGSVDRVLNRFYAY
ncbi:fructosamine kinase family protein [Evansella sp. AB-P1]|uniref:fructosamine kinase family protein n=1 Tax=Evansella sp. AB-P1 TaxID=3037653 RepID=UPI00241E45A1|nr:fructosamine kinase family protein [Evansella sp. AB-P1]MDG5787505.1 fructosamine kinase family protein [Evansella sp. AB-P1]